MATYSSILAWRIPGMEEPGRLPSTGSHKSDMTAAMDLEDACSLEEKIRQCIKEQRHYFANKGPSSQRYGFSSSMYGCDSWTIKKAERQRIDAFELWC